MKSFANSDVGKTIRSKNLTKTLNILWKNEEYIDRRRKSGREQALKNMNDDSYGYKKYKYNGISYRSTWEVKVAKCLDILEIQYEYEKHRFKYIDSNNIERLYIPDFYLIELNMFLEVKPENLINDITNIKIESVKNNGYRIEYITEVQQSKLSEKIMSL